MKSMADNFTMQQTNSVAISPHVNYTDRAKLLPAFEGRQRNGSPRPLISVFYTGAATFLSGSSSVVFKRLSGPRSRPTTSQKI
jgi:hypothetical protein